jgi:SAM-dependent methyltransferase
MDECRRTNLETWDGRVQPHVASEFYDVEGFRNGRCTLNAIEVAELGDVAGKSLLHLQCHFGMDTLSWARRGAKVTGLDFAPKAIAMARSLAEDLGIEARFVCCTVQDACKQNLGEFDIVFTSAGVLCWLPDLAVWARTIQQCLKPGGVFYIREFHPFPCMMDYDAEPPTVALPYFYSREADYCEGQGSYATGEGGVWKSYEWCHPISEILGCLMEVGLCIEFFHEFPYCSYKSLECLTQDEEGRWRYEGINGGLPLVFSLKAVKP